MAHLYPKKIDNSNAPYAEQLVFDALNNLGDDYYIFHSVQWISNKGSDKNFTWYENDFLIINRKRGFTVLEVKGGEISFENGFMLQKNIETGETVLLDKGNDPLSQAKRGMFYIRERILKEVPELKGRLKYFPSAWFPRCLIDDNQQLPMLYQDNRNALFDASSLKTPAKIIHDAFEHFCGDTMCLTDDELTRLINIIAPDFKLISSPNIIKGEIEEAFVKLTKEQSYLLDYISEIKKATIQGAAGTGKTLLAIEAAKRFAENEGRVLFLCFNKLLLTELKKSHPNKNIDYFTINSYVSTFTELDVSSPKIRSQELQKLDIDKFHYKAIVIDEAQDFENEEMSYLMTLADLNEIYFLAFYDKNQMVLSHKLPEWMNKTECRLLLTRNCRNTYEIAKTAYNVIDVDIKQKVNMVSAAETQTVFSKALPIKDLGSLILYFKDEGNGYADNEITILSMKKEEESILHGTNQVMGVQISREKNNSNVFFTTAKKFKGLESKVIIVTDIDETCFKDEQQKRTFYVACSRAKQRLALLIDGTDDKIKSISNAIGQSPFAAKGNILTKTKTVELKI